MGKKNTKGTQKLSPLIDASNASPPYETAFGSSNTEEVKIDKKDKQVDLHTCKCKNPKNIRKPTRTWESIKNLYGDVDTTEVWDNEEQKPKTFFSLKSYKRENPEAVIEKSELKPKTFFRSKSYKHEKPEAVIEKSELKPKTFFSSKSYKHENPEAVIEKSELKPKTFFSFKSYKHENPEAVIEKSENNDIIIQPMSNLKKKPAKLSLLSLYRKRKTNDNKIKIGPYVNKESKDTGVKSLGYTEPKFQFMFKKKPKKRVKDHYALGDVCKEGPCREALENLYNLHGLQYTPNIYEKYEKEKVSKSGKKAKRKRERKTTKTPAKEIKTIKEKEKEKLGRKSKKKQIEAIKATKEGNVGYGDQIAPNPLKNQDFKEVQCKCSFIGKIMKRTICKCKSSNKDTHTPSSNINNQNGDPILEMKVNSTDMRVINSIEVNEKIRKLGRNEKNMSCVCPSRMRRLYGDNFCERGLCEEALKNRDINFHCKCRKQNLIECKDSTCNLKGQKIKADSKKKKRSKERSPGYSENNKPLLKVMLDSNKMNIINSDEIEDIIRNTSQNKIICPTGICRTLSKKNDVEINCKCVGRKLTPFLNECEEGTCRNPERQCRLSYLCSRVFSKSENWTRQEENKYMRSRRGNRYGRNDLLRSHTLKKNGVMINLPSGQTPTKESYEGWRLADADKCICECKQKNLKIKKRKKEEKKKKEKKTKPKKKVTRRRKRRRRGFFKRKKKDDRILSDKILDCLEKEQEQCEKRIKKKTKEYHKNEKNAIKENLKMLEEQKAYNVNQNNHWNYLTSFIAGVFNIGLESLKIVLKIPLSLIGDPVSSYVYVREKSKDPPAAIMRIYEWFIRTWKNKSTVIARKIEESHTMNVLADQIEDSALYNVVLSPRGKSEKMLWERKRKIRKRRMRKRQDEALYGCRHMLLTTMRKTPCLWFYHICPELYPQCLGFVSFVNNFAHIILYLGAIMCWTPCILACEMFRACMCCFFCTN